MLVRGLIAASMLLAAAAHGLPAQAAPLTPDQLVGPLSEETTVKYPELEEALAKFESRDFQGALESLKKASANHLDLPPALVLHAKLLVAANQLQPAIHSLEQAVQENPEAPEPYLELGDLATRQRRYTEASLLFDKAKSLTDAFSGNEQRKKAAKIRCHAGMAAVAEARQNWETAQEHFNAWLELNPENASTHYRLGQTLFGLKKYEDAYEKLQTGAEKDPNLPRPAITMGMLYDREGNHQKALEWMDFAVNSQPEDLATRMGVARYFFQQNDLARAEEHAKKIVEIDPTSLEGKLLLGVIARYLKKYDEAEKQFEAAYLQSPGAFLASNQLALTLAEQDDSAKQQRALELAQLNARQYPKNAEAGVTLGWVYYQLHRLDEARRTLATAASLGTVSADAAYYMAKVASDQGRQDEARRLLETALSNDGPFAHRSESEKWLAELTAKNAN